MTSLVSVVIPTYNRMHCVGAAIDSALAQTHAEIEVIVVDDGSTDGTEDFMHTRYAEAIRGKRLHYIRQKNAGVAAARNHALRLSRGAFVAFLDSDDSWEPWKIEVQLDVLRHFPDAGLVWTDMAGVDSSGNIQERNMLRTICWAYRWYPTNESLFDRSAPLETVSVRQGGQFPGKFAYEGDIFSPLLMGSLFLPSTTLIRRKLVERVGFFREDMRLCEDYEFLLRICRETRVAYADVSSTRYQRGRPDQLTRPDLHIKMLELLLQTISPIFKKDRARITLSKAMINSRLGESRSDFGEALLERGRNLEAAKQFALSLWHLPFESRIIGLLALSFLPGKVTRRLRHVYQRTKGKIIPS